MLVDQLNKTIQLVEGTFTPAEVNQMLIQSIDNQINNYKLKNLSNWIHDHNCDQTDYNNKIAQLEQKKQELQRMIQDAQNMKCNVKLRESVEIGLDRNQNN